jgi:hypothetical protein
VDLGKASLARPNFTADRLAAATAFTEIVQGLSALRMLFAAICER